MLLWPSVDDSLGKALTTYPESVKTAFGVGTLSSAAEFLSVEQFSLILPFALGLPLETPVNNAQALASPGFQAYLPRVRAAAVVPAALAMATR